MNDKDLAIYNVLEFNNTGDEAFLNSALTNLNDLAKKYRVKSKISISNKDLLETLAIFVKNDNGFINTIPLLITKLKQL